MRNNAGNPDQLIVLWTSGDKAVAENMVFMYTLNAKMKGWWKEVCLIVWGPSSRLLAEDAELQEYIKVMKENGVVLKACKACADRYGVTKNLENMGINVIYIGELFTRYLKKDYKVITI